MSPLKFATETASFLTESGIVVFTEYNAPGMVGESNIFSEAVLLTDGNNIENLEYDKIRAIYCKFKDTKANRIGFWGWMQSMSPEAQAIELDRSTAEAISRVI